MLTVYMEDKQRRTIVARFENRSHALALARVLNNLVEWNRYVVGIGEEGQGQQSERVNARAIPLRALFIEHQK